jgi:hypothetical protein
MSTSRKTVLLAVALSATLAAPALAQSNLRYANDPDALVRAEVQRDHARTYGHPNVVLPRSSVAMPDDAAFTDSVHYATDPDPSIRDEIKRDHAATFGHPAVLLPRSGIDQMKHRGYSAPKFGETARATDPDAAIRGYLNRDIYIR